MLNGTRKKASHGSTKFLLALLCFLSFLYWPGRALEVLHAQVAPSEDPAPLVILLAKLDGGDVAGAERLMQDNLAVTKSRLEDLIGEIDQRFDELGRFGATSGHEVHTAVLEELVDDVRRYEKLFDLYRRLSGEETLYKRLVARKWRIEGAALTHEGEDACGDHLDWEEAQRLYRLALERLETGFSLAQEVHDLRLMASAKNNMGSTLIRLVEPQQALAAYNEAMQYAEQLSGEMYTGMVNLNLGNTYVWAGDPDTSLPYSQAALTSFKKMGRGTWEANALMNIGNAYLRQKKFSSAWEMLQVAVEAAKQSGEDRIRGRALLNLGMAGLQLNRPEGRAFLEEALDWYAEGGADVYPLIEKEAVRQDGLRLLSRIARQAGEEQAAEQYMKQFYESVGSDPDRYGQLRASPCFAIYQARPIGEQSLAP